MRVLALSVQVLTCSVQVLTLSVQTRRVQRSDAIDVSGRRVRAPPEQQPHARRRGRLAGKVERGAAAAREGRLYT